MQVAEDIDLSMRLQKAGFQTALISEAFVYHRRKATLYKFFKQLYFHGKGRIDLHLKHGDALKMVHMLPSIFVLYLLLGFLLAFFTNTVFLLFLGSFAIYVLAVLINSTASSKSISVGLLSVVTSIELLVAYGLGVWRNIIYRIIFKKGGDSRKALILKE
jgi:GT2 family glycosyltransferase